MHCLQLETRFASGSRIYWPDSAVHFIQRVQEGRRVHSWSASAKVAHLAASSQQKSYRALEGYQSERHWPVTDTYQTLQCLIAQCWMHLKPFFGIVGYRRLALSACMCRISPRFNRFISCLICSFINVSVGLNFEELVIWSLSRVSRNKEASG